MLAVLDEAKKMAESGANILIEGETGTGKELIARGIHLLSGRKGKFVPVNCAGCPLGLLEAELFGVERGAFTGADRKRPGLIQTAAGGTLFLDEIGDLKPESQGVLLRFLDSGEVRPLGSRQIRTVALGIVAATLRPLLVALREGIFRSDLYYRLTQGCLRLPPLRERLEDLELLVEYLWPRLSRGEPAPEWILEPDHMKVLRSHLWPGNIRELKHFLHRTRVRFGHRDDVTPAEMQELLRRDVAPASHALIPTSRSGHGSLSIDEGDERGARVSWSRIYQVLASCDGNHRLAAERLGISRAKLYRILSKSRLG